MNTNKALLFLLAGTVFSVHTPELMASDWELILKHQQQIKDLNERQKKQVSRATVVIDPEIEQRCPEQSHTVNLGEALILGDLVFYMDYPGARGLWKWVPGVPPELAVFSLEGNEDVPGQLPLSFDELSTKIAPEDFVYLSTTRPGNEIREQLVLAHRKGFMLLRFDYRRDTTVLHIRTLFSIVPSAEESAPAAPAASTWCAALSPTDPL